tara:strand:- start:14 stop:454 length:441 start_codon:yes stop_codon:yes gene_type:complete
MRLYSENDLNLYNIKQKLKQFKLNKNESNIMLTNNGLYKYVHGDLFLFKLYFKEKSKYCYDYIDNKNFIITPNKWVKVEQRYQLPVEHHIFEQTILSYSSRDKSPVKFICEYINNELNDYYFIIPDDSEMDPLVKEDICSFLAKLD